MADTHGEPDLLAIPRITASETWELKRRGERVVIVDVRRPSAHARAHIPDDYLYPKKEYDARKGELPRDALLVLY
jgi:rhodanese-related sulfurtransferase